MARNNKQGLQQHWHQAKQQRVPRLYEPDASTKLRASRRAARLPWWKSRYSSLAPYRSNTILMSKPPEITSKCVPVPSPSSPMSVTF
mmetsp:Transcript_10369/g.33018  ORF Transcript_10369/g.33018 Transcript_10369/m.33018 type:complete len:87 (+) Transcript_10369:372-632(+)